MKSPTERQRSRNVNKRLSLEKEEVRVRLPSFGPNSRKRTHIQNINEASFKTQPPQPLAEVKNSHVPTRALDYLQFVDEPGIKDVVSKFNNFQHQSQFKNPLRQQTLYLNQVRHASRG